MFAPVLARLTLIDPKDEPYVWVDGEIREREVACEVLTEQHGLKAGQLLIETIVHVSQCIGVFRALSEERGPDEIADQRPKKILGLGRYPALSFPKTTSAAETLAFSTEAR